MQTAIQASYDSVCPDCGKSISESAFHSSACQNCGHVLYATAKALIKRAAVYCPVDGEPMNIVACEDTYFLGIGEETGENYNVEYSEVDVEHDCIYALVLING